jgi:tetratricopeptide (TPR) repeat protein
VTVQTNKTRPVRKKVVEPSGEKKYQKALDLAEVGKHEEALECIQKYLVLSPNNAEILNDTGAILYCLKRSEEAIKHFLKAKELKPDSAEILWNLSETYLSEGRAKEAAALFENMEKIGILNAEVLNRTADMLVNSGDLNDAHKVLKKSLELSPNQPILEPILKIIAHKMAEN